MDLLQAFFFLSGIIAWIAVLAGGTILGLLWLWAKAMGMPD